MKGDQIGTLTAHPSLQELSLSNWTWFNSLRARRTRIGQASARLATDTACRMKGAPSAHRSGAGTTRVKNMIGFLVQRCGSALRAPARLRRGSIQDFDP